LLPGAALAKGENCWIAPSRSLSRPPKFKSGKNCGLSAGPSAAASPPRVESASASARSAMPRLALMGAALMF